jgi:hypothetical protein
MELPGSGILAIRLINTVFWIYQSLLVRKISFVHSSAMNKRMKKGDVQGYCLKSGIERHVNVKNNVEKLDSQL